MRQNGLERDLSVIYGDAARLPTGQNVLTIGGRQIQCEPAQPYAGLSPDFEGEWGSFSGRVIVRSSDIPSGVKVGDSCTYGGEKRRVAGMERNVDGLTVEITLSGIGA